MPTLLNISAAPLQQIEQDDWLSPDGEPLLQGVRRDSARHLAAPEAFDPAEHQGLWLSVDSEPPEPLPQALQLIAIDFAAFNDGRGLSLAVLLRSRYGYSGELRAVGETHPDLLHYLRRCGFDSALLPEPHTLAAAKAAFDPYSDYYQASVSNPEPAFRRMRRGA